VKTVREPLLVLDKDLHLKMANQSFLGTSRASKRRRRAGCCTSSTTVQWDIPEPRRLLEDIIPQHTEWRRTADHGVGHPRPPYSSPLEVAPAKAPGALCDDAQTAVSPSVQIARIGRTRVQ
jgi:hypothetical protein